MQNEYLEQKNKLYEKLESPLISDQFSTAESYPLALSRQDSANNINLALRENNDEKHSKIKIITSSDQENMQFLSPKLDVYKT